MSRLFHNLIHRAASADTSPIRSVLLRLPLLRGLCAATASGR